MEIIRAKTAGFCFGVDRAVKLTYDLLAQGRKVATLGPLIHNAQVVADLEAKGAVTCPDIDAVPDGDEVIIRSHGVPRSVYDKISTRSLAYHDATCPFVAKIHKIAMEADKNGANHFLSAKTSPISRAYNKSRAPDAFPSAEAEVYCACATIPVS